MEKKDPPIISRRTFLRRTFGLATAAVLAPLIPQFPSTQLAETKEPSPKELALPVDLISEERLKEEYHTTQVLRHEFAHFIASHHDSPNTDDIAREIVRQAFEAKQSGDDSLYYIVLQTSQEVIIT